MSNIYGSYDQMDWWTAVLLRKSIRWMKDTNPEKYAGAIERETEAYKQLFKSFSLPKEDISSVSFPKAA